MKRSLSSGFSPLVWEGSHEDLSQAGRWTIIIRYALGIFSLLWFCLKGINNGL